MSAEKASTKAVEPTRKSILELSNEDARRFFLKSENYFSLELPPYIAFGNLLIEVEQIINGKQLCDFRNCT